MARHKKAVRASLAIPDIEKRMDEKGHLRPSQAEALIKKRGSLTVITKNGIKLDVRNPYELKMIIRGYKKSFVTAIDPLTKKSFLIKVRK